MADPWCCEPPFGHDTPPLILARKPQRCPECDNGHVVIYGYEADTNHTDARCSDRCGWTS